MDFPKIDVGEEPNSTHTPFSESLIHFCEASEMPEDVMNRLKKDYDYSKSLRYAFVHSIGGSHFGDDAAGTGFCGLSQGVRQLGLQTNEALDIHYIVSERMHCF